jgi:hypothetical protein
MSISKHSVRRMILTVTALLLVAGSSVAAAANTRPAGLSPQAYRAEMIRGEAMNKLYGADASGPSRADQVRAAALDKRYANAWTRVSPAEFRTLVEAFGAEVTTIMTPQQARAELARGHGLNRLAARYAIAASPASVAAGKSFDWGDAGIGVAAAIGAMLLAAAAAIALRKRNRFVLHS